MRTSKSDESGKIDLVQHNTVDTNRLVRQLSVLDTLLKSIQSYRESRLEASLKVELYFIAFVLLRLLISVEFSNNIEGGF